MSEAESLALQWCGARVAGQNTRDGESSLESQGALCSLGPPLVMTPVGSLSLHQSVCSARVPAHLSSGESDSGYSVFWTNGS